MKKKIHSSSDLANKKVNFVIVGNVERMFVYVSTIVIKYNVWDSQVSTSDNNQQLGYKYTNLTPNSKQQYTSKTVISSVVQWLIVHTDLFYRR